MTRTYRSLWIIILVAMLLALTPAAALADEDSARIIESQVLVSTQVSSGDSPYALLVQATSRAGTPYVYILTLVNLSPWSLKSLSVLDRYLPSEPDQAEIDNQWYPEELNPGKAISFAIEFQDGPLDGGCHQLEISLADGLGTILMDCNAPNSIILWNVPLSDDMIQYLADEVLTLADSVGPSKVGLHVTRNSSPVIMEFVRDAQPAVIVAVGDLGWLADVKKVSPGTTTVGRFIEGDQSFDGDPVVRARDFVAANATLYLANPGVDYWLGWNEPVIDSIEQANWYATFESERARAMAELKLKVAIGNFSAGTPESDEFEAFVPAVAVAKELGGILAVHEYSAPYLQTGVGAGIPGLEGQAHFGSLTLRYRFWYDYYLKINDLVVPLVVTEAGIDGGVIRSNELSLMGWRDFTRNLPDDVEKQTAESYLGDLSWYDDELRRDPYVLGFAIFNVGDSDGRWASFDMTGMLPQLGGLVQSKAELP